MSDMKVVLKFGYDMSLCLSIKSAVIIMEALGSENLLRQRCNYKDGKSWELLEPYGTDQISINFLSPADYLIRLAHGEKTE